MDTESESNIELWKQLHVNDYFVKHPCYDGGIKDTGGDDVAKFEEYLTNPPLNPDGTMAVIGCGYGRESKYFALAVTLVYGIDVSPLALQLAVNFVGMPARFIPVLAENYKTEVPDVDYVYSHSLFQHIPHEITIDYVQTFKAKLKPGGAMLLQFMQHSESDKPYAAPEPSYSWNFDDLNALFEGQAQIITEPFKMKRIHHVYYENPFT